MSASSERIEFLELGRGVAALMVVILHATHIVAESRFYGETIFGRRFDAFNVGVDFFFVLSGFLMTVLHWNDIGKGSVPAKLFIIKRVIRLYPAYWMVALGIIAAYLVNDKIGVGVSREPGFILASILLLPTMEHPIVGVAWTLQFEVLFYASFACFICYGRWSTWLIAVWASALTIVQLSLTTQFPLSFLGSEWTIDFIIGVLVALLAIHYPIRTHINWLILAYCTFIITAMALPDINHTPLAARCLFGTMAGVIVFLSATTPPVILSGFCRSALIIGHASYSIYLLHTPLQAVLVRIIFKVVESPVGAALLLILIPVIIGVLFWHFVERPLLVLLRGWFLRKQRKSCGTA